MSFFVVLAKLIASLFLVVSVIVGSLMANPKWHSGMYRPAAEYGTGFILFVGGLAGLYLLW